MRDRRAFADELARHGGYALRVLFKARPDFYAQAVEGLGRQPTAADLDLMAEHLVAMARQGTPDEGKPLLKRMH